MIDNIKKVLKDIFVNDINKAISLADSLLLDSANRKSDFLLIKNRLTFLKDENSKGTISFDEVQKLNNQIAASFIHLIDRISLDDLDITKANQVLIKRGINPKKDVSIKERVISFKKLKKSSKPEIYDMIDMYKHSLNRGSLDDEIYFNLGLCYLHLKLFDLAVRYFEKALVLAPDNSDYHYYLGLAKIRNRRPLTLMPNDIRDIEQYVNSAMEIDSREGKYFVLSIILKYDYYHLNGLVVKLPSINELIENLSAKNIDPYEIQRLKESVPIIDTKLNQFVNQF